MQPQHTCQMHFGDPSKPCGRPAPCSYAGTDGKTYYACKKHYRQWFPSTNPGPVESFFRVALYVVAVALGLLILIALAKWSFMEVFRR